LKLSPRLLVEQPHVRIVAEFPIARLARDFHENPALDEPPHQLVGRGIRRPGKRPDDVHRHDGLLEQPLEYLVAVAGRAAEVLSDRAPVRLAERKNPARRFSGLSAHFGDPLKEKREPALPVAAVTYRLQPIVVFLTVTLEVVREVEHGFVKNVALTEKEG